MFLKKINWRLLEKLLLVGVLGVFVVREFYPTTKGFKLSPTYKREILDIRTQKTITFPPEGKYALLFWSTTCPPCLLEMSRLRSSVQEKSLSGEKIFAVNPYESEQAIGKFLKKNDYPFRFVKIPGLARELDVSATPTTAWFDQDKLIYQKTGVSLTGIFRLESFLK